MDNYSFANNSQLSTLNSQLLRSALQAAVEGGALSASCASLACGYENQALRANYTDANHFQFSIFN
jgi:hypothetical protein